VKYGADLPTAGFRWEIDHRLLTCYYPHPVRTLEGPSAPEIFVTNLEETIKGLKYDAGGLIPAVIVDEKSKAVLMVAYMNQASLLETIKTGKTRFWSRSRQEYWMKGQESGHTQDVRAVYTDCDKDTLVIEVVQHGAACHDGYFSCFYRRLNDSGQWEVIAKPLFDPKAVYKTK
jgi:phosphoribosyl-AMP cyclohydrolase